MATRRGVDAVLAGFDEDDDEEEDAFWEQAGRALDVVEEETRQIRLTQGNQQRRHRDGVDARDARANEPREAEDAVSLRRALDERDARLSMLRSKLDMVERENENLKRVGTTVAVSTGTTTMAAPTTSYGNVGARNRVNANGSMAAPSTTNAANVVAKAEVQDLRQQLSTLKSKLAFKEEEIMEIRRAEEDARVKLRAANDERTRLAADVRAERRARATAGQKRSAASEETGAAAKRLKTSGSGDRATTVNGGIDGSVIDRSGEPSTSMPATLAVALPMAPPDVAATLYQRNVSGYHSNDNAFARLMNDAPLDVSSFLAKPNENSIVSAELVDPVRAALMNLATDPDSTSALTRALVESIVETSAAIASNAHYAHLASVLRILSALAMIDARSLSIVLSACGAQRNQVAASVTSSGAPPPSLAGVPGLGGAGMGTLVAHPRAQSARIFVPASTISAARVSATTPKPKTAKSKLDEDDDAAPFLETLIQLLADAKCDGQWNVVNAVLVALIRFASGVGVEHGRGAFGAVAQKRGGFGSCLKPIAPSGTRFLALMLIRVLAPTPEFQRFLCQPLEPERGIEKPMSAERRERLTLFGAVLGCLRHDCVDDAGLSFGVKSAFLAPVTPEQSGVLQEAALRVLGTLAFIGWPDYGVAAVASNALDVLAAVAVEEYVSPLPTARASTDASALKHATRLVHALLDEHYDAHLPHLLAQHRLQRVLARLAHLSAASGAKREARMGDWLGRILSKVRE